MENKAREVVMQRLTNVLKGQGMIIREDKTTSNEDKLVQMDVVLDIIRFLDQYDENVKVLNEYWRKKRYAEKYKQSKEGGERDD